MPRAATSVATSTERRPILKSLITLLRRFCVISPCSDAAEKPQPARYSVSSSTMRRVLQNTSERPPP